MALYFPKNLWNWTANNCAKLRFSIVKCLIIQTRTTKSGCQTYDVVCLNWFDWLYDDMTTGWNKRAIDSIGHTEYRMSSLRISKFCTRIVWTDAAQFGERIDRNVDAEVEISFPNLS